jgi:hypothetical protein
MGFTLVYLRNLLRSIVPNLLSLDRRAAKRRKRMCSAPGNDIFLAMF